MSKAYDAGLQQFAWWPDWKGECAAIVGCGPSIKQFDPNVLKERIHVIAIKEVVDICPWAEICYGCDAPWWIHRKGLPKFSGLKLYHGQQATKVGNMHKVEIDISKDDVLVEHPLKIGNGGCSGFQALNLAVQFGATDIILIGFDLHERGGNHWYGRNKWDRASNPMQTNYNRWNKGFTLAKPTLNRLGVNVINASVDSQLEAFPKKPLAEVMEEWGL